MEVEVEVAEMGNCWPDLRWWYRSERSCLQKNRSLPNSLQMGHHSHRVPHLALQHDGTSQVQESDLSHHLTGLEEPANELEVASQADVEPCSLDSLGCWTMLEWVLHGFQKAASSSLPSLRFPAVLLPLSSCVPPDSMLEWDLWCSFSSSSCVLLPPLPPPPPPPPPLPPVPPPVPPPLPPPVSDGGTSK